MEMPEHIKQYVTFDALTPEIQEIVKQKDRTFSSKNGLPKCSINELKKQLYTKNGNFAGMSIAERKDWYKGD